jgi:Flp pilus assembly pilin Flp
MVNVPLMPVNMLRNLDMHQEPSMKALLNRIWHEEDGVLSFEWTVLTSLLTVGVVSGIAAVRDSAIDEMGDLSQAMLTLDQSYVIEPPLAVSVHTVGGFGGGSFGGSSAWGSQFVDAAAFQDCYRSGRMQVNEFPGARRPDGTINPPLPAAPVVPEPSL